MNFMEQIKTEPGHFYAVGVGPGTADLVTFRAGGLIHSADVIIAPRSRVADKSLALEAAKIFLGKDQEVIEKVYAMKRNESETNDFWKTVAGEISAWVKAGKSVVQITIGDPLLYSTSHYLLEALSGKLVPESIHVIPGISAFQAAGARFRESLTIQQGRLMVMPATDLEQVEQALDHCETLVLYKAGKLINQLVDLLERRNLIDCAHIACYAEQPGREFLSTDLREAKDGKYGYMATVIIHIRRQKWVDSA
ncbi:MAG: precorrin-2 C(20)-methyltransferase [Desulfobacteraceae bacterium]|jgi:precorrin-2/cobalt-factor-2 C20-methyltransferase|nr:precorrin-2 C(20)-methyltransferase [Desulfobacteraceae bacterium]